MEQLEKALQESQDARFRMIVTDAVFSMDGEIAKLPEIGALAEKYEALVMIDECHGTGVLGKRGRGAIESTDMLRQIGRITFLRSALDYLSECVFLFTFSLVFLSLFTL